MLLVARTGNPVLVMPPPPRPHISFLRSCGFRGDDTDVCQQAFATNHSCSLPPAAPSMWTANAATVTPNSDTSDGRCHLTPANLSAHTHRAIEHHYTTQLLRCIFSQCPAVHVRCIAAGASPG